MKKKTIFALTMAFIMGALAVTPLFAQDATGVEIDTASYSDTTKHVKAVFAEAQIAQLAKMNNKNPMMAPMSLLMSTIASLTHSPNLSKEQKTALAMALGTIQIANLMGLPNHSMFASMFVAGYENAEDKDAYLTKVFSKLEYTGSENPEGELVNAIINQDTEAFRNRYDSLIYKDKLIFMQSVSSSFKIKIAHANANTETEGEPEVETEVETQAE